MGSLILFLLKMINEGQTENNPKNTQGSNVSDVSEGLNIRKTLSSVRNNTRYSSILDADSYYGRLFEALNNKFQREQSQALLTTTDADTISSLPEDHEDLLDIDRQDRLSLALLLNILYKKSEVVSPYPREKFLFIKYLTTLISNYYKKSKQLTSYGRWNPGVIKGCS